MSKENVRWHIVENGIGAILLLYAMAIPIIISYKIKLKEVKEKQFSF